MTDSSEKKISFGFTKLVKNQSSFIKPKIESKKVELIDCLEGQSIKIKNKVEEIKSPLIIPIPENSRSIVDRIKNECLKNEKLKEDKLKNEQPEKPESEMTLDELAVRELLKDAKNRENHTNKPKIHTLPLVEEKLIIEGKEESTLEDYESVPIGDYGMAMLRGMGWNEDIGIGKNPKNAAKVEIPELRPRGMGLGADKMAKKIGYREKIVDKDGKELKLIKGAFGKINGGRNDGYYCEVQSLDDETGRIIVKTAIGGTILTLNEFRISLVTKGDYDKNSKIIIIVVLTLFITVNTESVDCPKICPLLYAPRCAVDSNGNHKLFDNECALKVENCQHKTLNNAKYSQYKEKEEADGNVTSKSIPKEEIQVKKEFKPDISSSSRHDNKTSSKYKTDVKEHKIILKQEISSDSDNRNRRKHSIKSNKSSSKSRKHDDDSDSTEDEHDKFKTSRSKKKSSSKSRKHDYADDSTEDEHDKFKTSHSKKKSSSKSRKQYEDSDSTEDKHDKFKISHSMKKYSSKNRKYEEIKDSSSEERSAHRRKRKSSSSDSRDSSEEDKKRKNIARRKENTEYSNSSSEDSDDKYRKKSDKSSKHKSTYEDKKHKKHSKDKKKDKKNKDYDDRHYRNRRSKY